MDNPDHPHAPSPGNGHDRSASNTRFPDRTRLEKILTKGMNWKKQTLRNIDASAERIESDTLDHELKTVQLASRLSAQLEERNEEIERLRQAIAKLETEKSRLDRAHRRELERLQDAYHQFEKESDRLISELDHQN